MKNSIPCQSKECYSQSIEMEFVPSLSDRMKNYYICRTCGKGISTKTKFANNLDTVRAFGLLATNVVTIAAYIRGHSHYDDDINDNGGW